MQEKEWRRNWKQTLETAGWQLISTTIGESLLLKSVFGNDFYEIALSDRTHIWHEKLCSDDFRIRIKSLNPTVEAPMSKLLDHLKDCLYNTKSQAQFSLMKSDEDLMLKVSTRLAGVPFLWEFHLISADRIQLAAHLTQPLLVMISELNRQKAELFRRLKDKDKELADLRAQGVKSSRKHLQTEPFDEIKFNNDMIASKAFESNVSSMEHAAFNSESQMLYSEVMMKHCFLQSQPVADDITNHIPTFDTSPTKDRGTAQSSWMSRIPASIVNSSEESSPNNSPVKSNIVLDQESELERRQQLEEKLKQSRNKDQGNKRKKKIKF